MAQRVTDSFERITSVIGVLPQLRTAEMTVTFESSASTLEENYAKLAMAGEVGRHLIPAYAAAVEAEPVLADALIVPYQDDEIPALAGFAAAARAPYYSESARSEMLINVGDWNTWAKIVRKRRYAIAEIARKAGWKAEDVSPKEFTTFTFLHEGGHVKRFALFDFDAETIESERQEGLNTLPVPGVDPPSLIKSIRSHPIKSYLYMRKHRERCAKLGIHSLEQLIVAQEQAYRQLPDEDFADRFALDVMQGMSSS